MQTAKILWVVVVGLLLVLAQCLVDDNIYLIKVIGYFVTVYACFCGLAIFELVIKPCCKDAARDVRSK